MKNYMTQPKSPENQKDRPHKSKHASRILTRREMLTETGGGLAGIALAWLTAGKASLSAKTYNALPKSTHFTPKAKQVIFIYMGGGPSQMDLFDPKPMLTRYNGGPIPFDVNQRAIDGSTKLMGSPFSFRKYGQSGIELSELLPGLSEVVDEIALIRSGVTTRIDHGEALLMMHTGRPLSGFPSMGCWITYALGSENENMPAYIAIPDSGPERTRNAISCGWLPALYQGTPFNVTGTPIFDLKRPDSISEAEQRRYLDLTQSLNQRHRRTRPGITALDARIRNFELAATMQVEAMQQVDLSRESEPTKRLYGMQHEETNKFGTQCLIARRLIESGVRFVHLIRNDWDHHSKLHDQLVRSTGQTDRPVAGLIQDLKQRGLLDSTLVIWAGEFGRLPVVQGTDGRDHNPYGFSFWMAGGGIKGGTVHGATDDFSYKAVLDPVTMPDFHTTILHQLGLDSENVSFPFEGRDETLTGPETPRIIHPILA